MSAHTRQILAEAIRRALEFELGVPKGTPLMRSEQRPGESEDETLLRCLDEEAAHDLILRVLDEDAAHDLIPRHLSTQFERTISIIAHG